MGLVASMRDYPLHYEERVAVIRQMLNEDSIRMFPSMTAKQRDFVRTLMGVADGQRHHVPRKYLMNVRVPRRFTPTKTRGAP
jgi:hypothetical protein